LTGLLEVFMLFSLTLECKYGGKIFDKKSN